MKGVTTLTAVKVIDARALSSKVRPATRTKLVGLPESERLSEDSDTFRVRPDCWQL